MDDATPLSGPADPAGHDLPAPGSVLIRAVRVVDVDGGRPAEPTDVRVSARRVVAVGTHLDREPWDELVDGDGRWVLPGLWDSHTHMDQWASARRRLDVSAADSAREVAALVVERVRTQPPADGETVVGIGFRDGLWVEPPTAALLDAALAEAGLPPTPVAVVCGDLHSAWLSTPALERVGWAGRSDGVLREDDWFPLMGRLEHVDGDVRDRWVVEALATAASRGVVGVVDLELADDVAVWRRRARHLAQAGSTLPTRVVAGVWREYLDRVIAEELATGDVLAGTAGLVSVGPFKVISDGSLNTRTAYCHDPYPGLEGDAAHGTLNVPPEELVPLMAQATRHRIACAIHAIGDRANELALDAFEATGARGSIEHAQLLTREDVARMARLGLVASVQPEHMLDDRDVAERHWPGRTHRAFPLRELHEAGVPLAFGSDAPVAPLDPWLAVGAAVERTRDGREPWHPEQSVPVTVALAASVRSRVAVGQPGDLVLVEADPLRAHGEDLRRMPVAATMVGGRWSYRAG